MERHEYQDFFSQWGKPHETFFKNWGDWTGSYNTLYQPWIDAMKDWQNMKMPFTSSDHFSKWDEMFQETMRKATEQVGDNLGLKVLSRIMNASNIFKAFNEFWIEILKDLPELYEAKGDDAKSRKLFEKWAESYKIVFESLVGTPISDRTHEIMTSWLNIIQSHQATFGMMWNPWIQAVPQWQKNTMAFLSGDWSALAESRSLYREIYDETLGNVFRMPAFGLTKEQTERFRKTYDSFFQFWYSLPNLYQFFYNTGVEALKKGFNKIQNLKFEDIKPETLREIYNIWWTTNEDAFFELFKRPDFSNAMIEVLNCGLRFKKRLNELTAEWCKVLSIPSNQDFDQVAETIHGLRRKMRLQEKAIEKLQLKLEKAS